MTEQQWEDVFDVDLKAAWLTAREVLPDMIANKKGSIVNIASVHANMTYPSMFPYAAAKSGLVGLTRSMALEVGAHQVRVNALSPGYTETFLVKEFFERNDPSLRKKFWMSIQCTEWLNHQKLPIEFFSFRRRRPLLQERIGSLMVA